MISPRPYLHKPDIDITKNIKSKEKNKKQQRNVPKKGYLVVVWRIKSAEGNKTLL